MSHKHAYGITSVNDEDCAICRVLDFELEAMAQRILRLGKPNHETHALPLCAECLHIESLEEAVKIVRGQK